MCSDSLPGHRPMQADALEARIRGGIPISAGMDFRVRELATTHIRVSGGGPENVNVHNTAFAGSLYAICTLAAWGLVNSRLPDDAALVLAEGRIRYRAPVVGEILAECRVDAGVMQGFLGELRDRGRARIELDVRIDGATGAAVQYACELHASRGR